ncbi:MAG TPA: PhzF family phenazine biosynthesis isomerase, partial [Pedococcus sp.]|nr:PhzF family phenazine biosynthesis isomerase [Pedococcus sp.]
MSAEVLRYAAFPAGDAGGNPAGVVLDARGMTDEDMLLTAGEVGFSETAFLFPAESAADRNEGSSEGSSEARVRYFSPLAEVPFCGHATIATAVAHAERHGVGRLDLVTHGGLVPVQTRDEGGQLVATLTSVEPSVAPMSPVVVARTLEALRWSPDALDDALPPYVAFAGNRHPVLALSSRQVLAGLDYDYAALAGLMAEHDWTTMQLVHRERPELFHARNPFPPGGVVEDPATGAA